jgi:Fuc2NAc and GlcNAc transferase
LDIPSARSSHEQPTPRGGGLGIVLGVLLTVGLQLLLGRALEGVHIALLGGGIVVAATGWLDDRGGLGSYVRLGLYGLASAWAVFWLGGLPSLEFGVGALHLGGLGYILGWAAIMLLTNLFNFMDGIDGIAATEAATVGVTSGVLLFLGGDPSLAVLAVSLGLGSAAFLVWNWHPARIFMGDVGSNFLGFTIAVLAISSEGQHSLPALGWVLLLGVFVVDGLATFVRRLVRHKPPHEAHRTHAYQGAVQRGYSHSTVTLAVLSIDAVLAALALAAWKYPVFLLPSIGGAFLLLLALHWYYSPLRRLENG